MLAGEIWKTNQVFCDGSPGPSAEWTHQKCAGLVDHLICMITGIHPFQQDPESPTGHFQAGQRFRDGDGEAYRSVILTHLAQFIGGNGNIAGEYFSRNDTYIPTASLTELIRDERDQWHNIRMLIQPSKGKAWSRSWWRELQGSDNGRIPASAVQSLGDIMEESILAFGQGAAVASGGTPGTARTAADSVTTPGHESPNWD